MMHFEQLWEKCENFHKENSADNTTSFILDNLLLKVGLVKSVLEKNNLPAEELQQAKKLILGEVLFTLTNLSLKEDVNVFEALQIALQNNNIEFLSKKYQ